MKLEDVRGDMQCLLKWAKSYEEGNGESGVSDTLYDGMVRKLQRAEKQYPGVFHTAQTFHPEFKDGSWKYTGTFYKGGED